jgi:cbb3-type cytochrome oxidase subunit 1
MEWFVKAFLKTSISWLALGVTLGLAMVIHPPWTAFRTAHMHMNLLGFVSMMIFGVAYHVIPRFTGHPLHSRTLAGAHWWLANVGLVLLAAGFASLAGPRAARLALLATGGALSAFGAYAFAYNIWRTIDGPRLAGMVAGLTSQPAARRLPVSEASAR